MANPTPDAFLLPAKQAVELHDFLLGLPMRDVRVHVQRLESLKPLFSEESDQKETPDGDE